MASDNDASCVSDPNFAVICSFLERFGKPCGIAYPDFADLQEMIEDTEEVSEQLVELHIKLLRKTRKTVQKDKWEKALIKFCHGYNSQDGWEIERFGYKKSRTGVKLRLLKYLLEEQFDLNQKFKSEINRLSARELRLEPIGKDKRGLSYWHQLDEHCNLRIYCEDQDEETWELVAQDREGLVNLIAKLSGTGSESSIEPLINEDSNSLEIEKPILDTGQVEKSSSDDNESVKDSKTQVDEPTSINKKETSDESLPTKSTFEKTGMSDEIVNVSSISSNEEKVEVKQEQIEDKVEKAITQEEKVKAKEEKVQVKEEKVKAREEKAKAKEEKAKAKEEKAKAKEEKAKAEDEKAKAEDEKVKAKEEKTEVNEEKTEVKEEKIEAKATKVEKGTENTQIVSSPKKQTNMNVPEDASKYLKKVEDVPIDHSKLRPAQQNSLFGMADVISRVHGNLSRDLNICVASYRGEDQELDLSKTSKHEIQTHELDLSKKPSRSSIDSPHLGKSKHLHADSTKKKDKGKSKKVKMGTNDEVSEEIVEDVLIVRGEGSGKECQNSPIVESEIVEETMYFYGEGSGHDCLVANPQKEEPTSEKAECSDKSVSDQRSSDETTQEKLKESTTDTNPETTKETPHKSVVETNTNINDALMEVKEKEDTKISAPLPAAKRFLQINILNTEITSEHTDDNNENEKSPSIFNETIKSDKPTNNEVVTQTKKPMFFFGPGSLTNKPETVITEKSILSKNESNEILKSSNLTNKMEEKSDLSTINTDNFNDNKTTETALNANKTNEDVNENLKDTNEEENTSITQDLNTVPEKTCSENCLKSSESDSCKEKVSLKKNKDLSSSKNQFLEASVNDEKSPSSSVQSMPESGKSSNQISSIKEGELVNKKDDASSIESPVEKIKELLINTRVESQAPQIDVAKRKIEDFTSISKLIAKDDDHVFKDQKSMKPDLTSLVIPEETNLKNENKLNLNENVVAPVKVSEPIFTEVIKDKNVPNTEKISTKNELPNTMTNIEKDTKISLIPEKAQSNSEDINASSTKNNLQPSKDHSNQVETIDLVKKEDISKEMVKNESKNLHLDTTTKNLVEKSITSLKCDSNLPKEKTSSKKTPTESVKLESKLVKSTVDGTNITEEKFDAKDQIKNVKETSKKIVDKSKENQIISSENISKPAEVNFQTTIVIETSKTPKTTPSGSVPTNELKNELSSSSIKELKPQSTLNCHSTVTDDKKIDAEIISHEQERNIEKISKVLSNKPEVTVTGSITSELIFPTKKDVHEKVETEENFKKEITVSSADKSEKLPVKTDISLKENKSKNSEIANEAATESSDEDNANDFECSMSVHDDDDQEPDIDDTKGVSLDEEPNLTDPLSKEIAEETSNKTTNEVASELKDNESLEQLKIASEILTKNAEKDKVTVNSVPLLSEEDSITIDTDNSIDVQETLQDPLAYTENDSANLPEVLTSSIENAESILSKVEEIKPDISLTDLKMDETTTEKPVENQVSRKRTRGSDCTNEVEEFPSERDSGGKRVKLRSKRSVDTELRKSIEKKKQEERASSSDEESQLQLNEFKMEEETELKSEPPRDEVEATPEEPTVRVTRRGVICHPPRLKKVPASQSDSNTTKITQTTETTTEKKITKKSKKSKTKAKKDNKTTKPENEVEQKSEKPEKPEKLAQKDKKTNDKVEKVNEKPIDKPVKRRKTLLGLDIDEDYVVPVDENDRGVRQSRRIAQIKIKEEAERRKLEEITLNELKAEQKKKSKKDEDKDYKSEKRKKKGKNASDDDSSNDAVEEVVKKRKKKKKGLKFDEANPWKSSSDSSTSEDDEEEPEVEEEPSDEENLVFKSDHEFSPESDLEDGVEAEPLKRARTAKVESDVEETDEYACQKCGKLDHPEWILLCDSCDHGWHCSCLRPALFVIPEGDWFCPPCQHKTLIIRLQEKLEEFDKLDKQLEQEELQRQRLEYVSISTANIITDQNEGDDENNEDDDDDVPQRAKSDKSHSGNDNSDDSDSDDGSSGVTETSSSSSSEDDEPIYKLRERRQANSYRFNEYDDLINSAIKDDLDSVKGAGNQGRGKDISTIVNAEKEEKEALRASEEFGDNKNDDDYNAENDSKNNVDEDKPALDGDSSDDDIPRVRKRFIGKKKHAKLTSLDISSEDDADSDEDFKGSSSDDEDEDFDESALSEDSDDMGYRRKNKNDGPVRRSSRRRATRYDREFINDDSDEDVSRSKKSRSVWEDSYSEESDGSWGRKKKRPKKPRRTTTTSQRSSRKKKTSKSKKKKHDSDSEVYRERKPKKPKIVYGGLNEADEDNEEPIRRTRGRKINYLEALGSDSDEDGIRPSVKPIIESEEEYVADEEEKDSDQENLNLGITKPNTSGILNPDLMKLQSLSSSIIAPTKMHDAGIDDFNDDLEGDEDLLEDDEISKVGIGSLDSDELGELDEDELAELMMGDEAFATKQLDFTTAQIAKDKKKKERELKKQSTERKIKDIDDPFLAKQLEDSPLLHNILAPENQPKKRGRKSKRELEEIARLNVSQLQSQNIGPLTVAAMQTHNIPILSAENSLHSVDGVDTSMSMSEDEKSSEASTPSLAHLNIRTNLVPGEPSKISPLLNSSGSVDGTPKRRGRGKGKKTLAAEAAAAAAKGPTSAEENPSLVSGKLGIAPPPQPFTQSQPSPSVITRMLQSQPVLVPQNYNQIPGHKFFSDAPPNIRGGPPPQFPIVGPRGRIPSPYRPQLATIPHYPPGTTSASPHRPQIPTPGAPIFHTAHHPLDPSPSGGGPITIPGPPRDGNSPIIPQSTNSPIANKSTSVPIGRFPPDTNSAAPTTTSVPPPPLRHHIPYSPANLPQPSPSTLKAPFPPYPPQLPPNYHYGAYPPPTLPPGDDAIPPPTYQGSPYPEHYTPPENTAIPHSDNSNSKPPFDEEGSGEFGGLVSYFSSQREDDLDS